MAADGGVVRVTEEDVEHTELDRVISRPMLIFFIVGDILGAGIYALTGQVAGDVGGAIWASFLVSFVLAFLTAFAYMELVTKYPRAAGAALYVHRAFRINFLTFLVTFAVAGSGIRSMSDSWMCWKPRIEDPSKPIPAVKRSALSSPMGMEKCC